MTNSTAYRQKARLRNPPALPPMNCNVTEPTKIYCESETVKKKSSRIFPTFPDLHFLVTSCTKRWKLGNAEWTYDRKFSYKLKMRSSRSDAYKTRESWQISIQLGVGTPVYVRHEVWARSGVNWTPGNCDCQSTAPVALLSGFSGLIVQKAPNLELNVRSKEFRGRAYVGRYS